jgi:hypothetical protein
MDSKRDDLDKLIADSFEAIKIDSFIDKNNNNGYSYNSKLLSRLHEEKTPGKWFRTAAVSLITAGILIGFMYTSDIQYQVTSIECKIKTDFAIMKDNIDIGKIILGE